MDPAHRQTAYPIRCDWGLTGALATTADVVVVVDVLSFTTAVTVAADGGTTVFPYEWNDATAAEFAAAHDAVLAVGRTQESGVSLSPASIRRHPGLARLVLPSPNGSTICKRMAATATVYAASLRNASAVADHVGREHPAASVAVIAGGERWPDGSLRPAVEDLWGAGAVIKGLVAGRRAAGAASPEALSALAAFGAVRDDLPGALRGCASGRELIARGFDSDVEIAAEWGASAAAPLLQDGKFDT